MLSDEERMAIEHLKNYPINWLIENVNASAIKIILNLIEKQSKEIEHQKEIEDEKIFIQLGEYIGEKNVKDRIKAKIEEVSNGTYDAKIVLQSLLEKE